MEILAFLGFKKFDDGIYRLYNQIVAQARIAEFYTIHGVADTVNGRFDLVALHAYIVMRRLKNIGEEGGQVSQDLFDIMFADMDRNMREMGVGDLRVGKKVKALAKSFYGRIKAYDDGIVEFEDAMLTESLKRNLYHEKVPTDAQVQTMADYVLQEIKLSNNWNIEQIKNGSISFSPALVKCLGSVVTNETDQKITNEDAPLATPEISRIVKIDEIKSNHLDLDIGATVDERQALAERFDLIELKNFSAHLLCTISPKNTGVHIDASFSANVIQRCVVTLEPVLVVVTGSYQCDYSVEIEPGDVEIIKFDSAAEDPPEPIIDGAFDAGIILTEQFGLELETFPRSSNADFNELKLAAG
ncbi:MAG: ubiquinol-cytochrome C chaperone family protein, partial [Rhodospirillales bacterium]|nr:ubiquinol-cytochrome C chaperone family protein [Rhodospirillales bacterium]